MARKEHHGCYARAVVQAVIEAEPARVGRYRVLRKTGAGTFGELFVAYDEELDRKVAIELVGQTADIEDIEVRLGAKALARLSHPNVLAVHEVGQLEHAGAR